jgi:hypothetical protein
MKRNLHSDSRPIAQTRKCNEKFKHALFRERATLKTNSGNYLPASPQRTVCAETAEVPTDPANSDLYAERKNFVKTNAKARSGKT